MNYDTLLTTIENNSCVITINRPDKLNALNKNVFNDLDKAIDEVINNPEIKSAIITGAGPKAFVAGADIAEFAGLTKEQAMDLAQRGQDIFFKIENCYIDSTFINLDQKKLKKKLHMNRFVENVTSQIFSLYNL